MQWCSEMASKSVLFEMTKEDKLNKKNYNIWHRKVQYLLNEHELLITWPKAWLHMKLGIKSIIDLSENLMMLDSRIEVYALACNTTCMMTLLGSLRTSYSAKEMWDQLRLKYDGMSTIRLCALALRFNKYVIDSKHSMVDHLSVMSAMIRKLKIASHDLSYEQ